MHWILTRVVAGFVAGFLAVMIFHQGMYVLIQKLLAAGVLGPPPLSGTPWDFSPDANAYRNLPRIINQSFWGGLWGILFAMLIDRMPGGLSIIKGLIFGLVFPMLLGSWLLVPLIKANVFGISKPPQVLFSGAFGAKGFEIARLRNGFLLNGVAFGIGLGLLYPMLRRVFSR